MTHRSAANLPTEISPKSTIPAGAISATAKLIKTALRWRSSALSVLRSSSDSASRKKPQQAKASTVSRSVSPTVCELSVPTPTKDKSPVTSVTTPASVGAKSRIVPSFVS